MFPMNRGGWWIGPLINAQFCSIKWSTAPIKRPTCDVNPFSWLMLLPFQSMKNVLTAVTIAPIYLVVPKRGRIHDTNAQLTNRKTLSNAISWERRGRDSWPSVAQVVKHVYLESSFVGIFFPLFLSIYSNHFMSLIHSWLRRVLIWAHKKKTQRILRSTQFYNIITSLRLSFVQPKTHHW